MSRRGDRTSLFLLRGRAASGRWWPGVMALVAGVLCTGLALALTFPPLGGRVVDAAGVLDPATRSTLEARLAAQEHKATDQFVVATVPSLQGTSVEDYANALFRAWKLGEEKKNNGVLLLVAPNERKVRIEVGYGLEGILTDAVAAAIIREAIVPAFKAGDMSAGILKGADAVISVLNLDPEEARDRARRAAEPQTTPEEGLELIVLVILVVFWIYIFWRAARSTGNGARMAGRRRGAGEGAAGPITTWDWNRGGSSSSSSSSSWSRRGSSPRW